MTNMGSISGYGIDYNVVGVHLKAAKLLGTTYSLSSYVPSCIKD